jgi:hypothetical protein
MIKIVEFTLCNALGHRHYWNQAHLAQALILLMPTDEGITLHLSPSSAGLVIVAASWPPFSKWSTLQMATEMGELTNQQTYFLLSS